MFVPNSFLMFPGSTLEDFTTFTEVDPGVDFTVTSNKITFTDLNRNLEAYIYKDYGAAAFDADFEIWFDFEVTEASENGDLLDLVQLRNSVGDGGDVSVDKVKVDFFRSGGVLTARLVEFDSSSFYTNSGSISENTTYYAKFTRDESVGAFGTIYLYLATSEANRESETWAISLSLALHTSKKDFQYLQLLTTLGDATSRLFSGTIENLKLVSY